MGYTSIVVLLGGQCAVIVRVIEKDSDNYECHGAQRAVVWSAAGEHLPFGGACRAESVEAWWAAAWCVVSSENRG